MCVGIGRGAPVHPDMAPIVLTELDKSLVFISSLVTAGRSVHVAAGMGASGNDIRVMSDDSHAGHRTLQCDAQEQIGVGQPILARVNSQLGIVV